MCPATEHSTRVGPNAPSLVIARLLDYFGRRTNWQRRLWNPGTVTVLQETLEAVDLLAEGHLLPRTVTELARVTQCRVGSSCGSTHAIRGGPSRRRVT